MSDREIAKSIECLADAVNNVAKAMAKKSRAPREPAWAKRLEAMMGTMGEALAGIKEAYDEHDAELQDVVAKLEEFAARETVNPQDTADLEALTERVRASTESMKAAVADADGADGGDEPVPDPADPANPADPGAGDPGAGGDPGDQPPA